MSYTALYRKFRPDTFEGVKGQDHIVTTLRNQMNTGRVGHAYLFCGTRGTGKTSIAKIFAKAVNCRQPVNGSPCLTCDMCRAIAAGSSMNVIEIDAASNNGVDNIREIRDEVAYPPTDGKYKVYIIDEVHMLSTGAFNALLKTLEEPPAYVIFILATTEAHRIPITILSRCQRYDFRRIPLDTITGHLRELVQEEGQEAEERALAYVARKADGSMRDALSLLDQCMAFYFGETLTYEKVLQVLGGVDAETFQKLLSAVCGGDVAGAVAVVEELIVAGRELAQFVTDFTWYLRNLLLLQISDKVENTLDVSAEQIAAMKEAAQKTDAETLMRYIRIFSELSNQLRYSTQKRIVTEVAIIKLCRPQMETGVEDLAARVKELERKIEEGVPAAPAPKTVRQQTEDEEQPEAPAVLPTAVPEDIKLVVEHWHSMLEKNVSGGDFQALEKANLSLGQDGQLLVAFDYRDKFDCQRMEMAGIPARLEEIIAETLRKQVKCTFRLAGEGQKVQAAYPDLRNIINMEIQEES